MGSESWRQGAAIERPSRHLLKDPCASPLRISPDLDTLPMIRVILLGRTGNNLFQYAIGRVLAEKHGVPLYLDATWFNRHGWSEVSHFLLHQQRARVIRGFSVASRALRKFTGKHHWEYLNVPVVREPVADQSFNASYLDAPPECVLFGYFQTPRYFDSMAGPLRDELRAIVSAGSGINAHQHHLATRLAQGSSVAVHVRRGDYLRNPLFQVCGMDHYRRAIGQMRERIPDARFYFFSDDPAWCRERFRDTDMETVDSGAAGSNPLHDLHLMSMARHHIIANSSYSWWAAWLADQADQHVIMPERWYTRGIKAPIEEKRWKT